MKISCYHCGQKLDVSDLPAFTEIGCPVCETRLIIPKPYGNLLLEEDIGEGPMAHVYRAMDITLDREIAVKVLGEDHSGNSEIAGKFINEARSASAINHPNVIPIYSCGEMEEQTYITMQYMEGGSLKKRIETGRPRESEVARWFRDVARGLESAYIHGVVHHNVKPSNVFLDVDANIKIGDFGLSRVLDDGRPILQDDAASRRISLDDSYYLSPEKISTGRQDIAGDIYSFGASMYHVFCGVPPFKSDSAEDNMKARFTVSPEEPKRIREDISPELNDLIVKMLSVYPSERPRSYAEITSALEEVIGGASDKPSTSDSITAVQAGKTVSDRERVRKPERIAPAKAKPQPKKKRRVITVTGDALSETDPVEEHPRSSPAMRLLRLIPVIVIALVLLLAVAHAKKFSWYTRTILPVIQRVLGTEDAEPAPEEE